MTPEDARARFPVLQDLAYLNAGSVGPLSTATHRAMVDWQEKALRGGRAGPAHWEASGDLRRRVRERLAALIAVPPEQLIITTSTTEGCNLVVTGMRLGPDDQVVTTDAEHPGLEAPVRASGARVRVATVLGRTPDQQVEAVAAAVTPRTRLVALSHVLWLSGQVLPLAEIKAAAGVPLLVDGAQSVGGVPVDAGVADFYTVSGQKWLCGPEMTGALYVADPERLRPQVAGYLSMHGEGVERLTLVHHSPSTMAGLLAALDERPEWAFARTAEMAERCRQALLDAGLEVHTPPGQSGLVALTPREDAPDAVARCLERGVVVRSLPNGWVRASCSWWTSDDDIARLVGALIRSSP